MGEEKDLEHRVETHPEGGIELENAAVLLDIDAAEARPGAAALKLAKDGHVSAGAAKWRQHSPEVDGSTSLTATQTILVPQPSDDPNDPLNWSETKKNLILFTISIAAFIADFQAAVGAPDLPTQAAEWHMSPQKVNYAGNLNVLLV
jgi:hypothetical protein